MLSKNSKLKKSVKTPQIQYIFFQLPAFAHTVSST